MANYSKQMAVASAAATSVLIACAGAQSQDTELVTDMADIESVDIEQADAAFNEVDDPIWPVVSGVDPAADRILRNWSDYLASAAAFTVVLEIAEDVLLPHGQMIQYGKVSEVTVQRPGSLHAHGRGEERRVNLIIHDGRCTLIDLDSNIYAITDVPTPLDDAIDRIVERYGLNVPTADIVSQDPYASVIGAVDYGYVVGRASVDGVDCHHLGFAQEAIDWQVWIQAGPKPLLRKLVITYKTETGWPQYTARFSEWDLAPVLSKHHFEYEPPADADLVDFLPNQPSQRVEIDQ